MTTTATTDGILVLQLGDGPNTVDEDLLAGLEGALDAVEADEDLRGLVTIGAGKAYSQGYDVAAFSTFEGDGLQRFIDRTIVVLARMLVAPVPTVAALNGHAFGYGAMLALAHDQRVQRADRGWFCLPEVDLGLQFHPLQLALIQAKLSAFAVQESILGGRRWDADTALAAGIVDATATQDELLTAACSLAEARAGKGRGIVTALKRDLSAGILAHDPRHAR